MAMRLLANAKKPQPKVSPCLRELSSLRLVRELAVTSEIRRSVIAAEALLLAHNGSDVAHARRVVRLALNLFKQMRVIHHLGHEAMGWLACAAILHDIAKRGDPERHEIVAQTIIMTSRKLELPATARRIVGLVARYHRKALPVEADGQFAGLRPTDREIVRRLAAILRVADGMDFGRRGLVSQARCHIAPGQIFLRCVLQASTCAEDRRALKARIMEKGRLWEEAFGCRLVVKWGLRPS